MIRILIKILLPTAALLLAERFIPGIAVSSLYIAFIVALLLGLANLIVKPVLFVLTLPLTIVTLGLFAFILNAFLFWFVAAFVEGFAVEGFLPAFLGALLVSAASWLANRLT